MSWWLEDARGFVGDVGTSRGLEQLRDLHRPALGQFLDRGQADADLLARLVPECRGHERTRYLADLLADAAPPIVLTDGVSSDDSAPEGEPIANRDAAAEPLAEDAALAQAIADDFEGLRRELDIIAELDDPAQLRKALDRWMAKLPSRAQQLFEAPRAAAQIERRLSEALLAGMAAPPETP